MNDPVILGGIDIALARALSERLSTTELVIVPPSKVIKAPDPEPIPLFNLCNSTADYCAVYGEPHKHKGNQPFYAAVSKARKRP